MARDGQRVVGPELTREPDREKKEFGPAAHRGKIREVHRGGAPAEPLGLLARQKIHALDEHVRRRELRALRGREDRGIVPDADEQPFRSRREGLHPLDEEVF